MGNAPPPQRVTRDSLTLFELDLIEQMETDPARLERNLGGKPFAIICAKGRRLRYRRLANYLGLRLYENGKKVRRQDGFVLIHAGEVLKWLPESPQSHDFPNAKV